jgi:hypothetical protein
MVALPDAFTLEGALPPVLTAGFDEPVGELVPGDAGRDGVAGDPAVWATADPVSNRVAARAVAKDFKSASVACLNEEPGAHVVGVTVGWPNWFGVRNVPNVPCRETLGAGYDPCLRPSGVDRHAPEADISCLPENGRSAR